MKLLRSVIIEDQAPARRLIETFLQRAAYTPALATFTDPVEAIAFLQTNEVDVVFLDIHLPKMSGLDLLRQLINPPQVIITTAFQDYALVGYELQVVDYLLKPFSFDRFRQAVERIKVTEPVAIFIKSGHAHLQVKLVDIVYINSDADYTEINTTLAKHLSSETLLHWEQTLPSNSFIRIHRSYLINLSYVDRKYASRVVLKTGKVLPVGRTYQARLKEMLG